MQDRCQSDIVIVQGDTYQKNVFVDGVRLDAIENVYFSCGKLGITRDLQFDEVQNCFVLLLSSSETASLRPVVTDFDITVKLFGEIVKTGLYRGKLMVLDKNNPVQEAF